MRGRPDARQACGVLRYPPQKIAIDGDRGLATLLDDV